MYILIWSRTSFCILNQSINRLLSLSRAAKQSRHSITLKLTDKLRYFELCGLSIWYFLSLYNSLLYIVDKTNRRISLLFRILPIVYIPDHKSRQLCNWLKRAFFTIKQYLIKCFCCIHFHSPFSSITRDRECLLDIIENKFAPLCDCIGKVTPQ